MDLIYLIYREQRFRNYKMNGDYKMPHITKHFIMVDGTNYEIGTHTVYDRFGMSARSEFVNDLDTENYTFAKIARFQSPGDMEIMLYRVIDRNNGEIFYHVVNNVKLYDENGFLEKIVYTDEYGPDNDVDAFREWATTIQDYMY